jgi:hypothetical protein
MASSKPSINASKIWIFFAIVNSLSVPPPRFAERFSVFRLSPPVHPYRTERADRFHRRARENSTCIGSRRVSLCLLPDFQRGLYGYRLTSLRVVEQIPLNGPEHSISVSFGEPMESFRKDPKLDKEHD